MIKQFVSRQFLAFLLTGGTAAVVNLASRILYNQWVGFSSAIILAYVTGMITAFILAKLFVFKESKLSTQYSALFFVLVNIVAVIQTWIVTMVLAYYLLPLLGFVSNLREIAHAVGVAIPVFTSYVGHKHWSFRE